VLLRLVEESGLDSQEFASSYATNRLAYDRADLSAAQFWNAVLGHPAGPAQLERLVRLDVEGWTRPDTASLEAVARAAERRKLSLAILSNAPIEVAEVTTQLEWLAPFSPQLYSCHLREVKPDPAIYALALQALDACGDEVIFVDDREPNVVAARQAGLRAERFLGPKIFDNL
jgi:putative hydrolase of the HAD superfamily